jgi:hypothetical protein
MVCLATECVRFVIKSKAECEKRSYPWLYSFGERMATHEHVTKLWCSRCNVRSTDYFFSRSKGVQASLPSAHYVTRRGNQNLSGCEVVLNRRSLRGIPSWAVAGRSSGPLAAVRPMCPKLVQEVRNGTRTDEYPFFIDICI